MRVFVLGGTGAPQGATALPELDELRVSCTTLGRALADSRHEILVCSPFPDSADRYVVQGAATVAAPSSVTVHFHYPNTSLAHEEIAALVDSTGISILRHPHAPPDEQTDDARRYAYLLAQLAAMDAADVVIAIGGRSDGSANLLLRLAEDRSKSVLPFSFLGGAARRALDRRYYELKDLLGDQDLAKLYDQEAVGQVGALLERLHSASKSRHSRGTHGGIAQAVFFISYPRARPSEANFLEMLLRRHGLTVLRDERDFGAGHCVIQEIRQHIHRASVFIAMWCREYACSPHCYDEFELALDRRAREDVDIWIFSLDETRVVPPRARNLLHYRTPTRDLLEGAVLRLLRERDRTS